MKLLLLLILYFLSCNSPTESTLANSNEVSINENSYTISLNLTGTSHLIVFLGSIEGLSPGDEIGVFDSNGVIETTEAGEDVQYGEVLVGSTIWDGNANSEGSVVEVSAIMSEDLSDFGGPVLNGAVVGNGVVIRVYDVSEGQEYNTNPSFGIGGAFGDLFTTVTALNLTR
tara:strand:+ start:217 stop:729 length:513 start_codon:yes stop_codon:yes gene_type:complete